MHRDDPKPLASAARGTRYADRVVRAPRGVERTARSWLTEAALRMLQNNLDPEVAENPKELVVYGGIGRAARNWECFDAICEALRELGDDESLLIQSGKPVGVFKTHSDAPRVLIANSNLVPKWATWDHFNELDRKGLMMFGQMTAGSWIYIGSQGIVQGTYETFAEAGRQHCGDELADKWILTAGLGGMGGAQPLAATLAGASMLAIECQQSRIEMRLATRYLDRQAKDLDDALAILRDAGAKKAPVSVGLLGNAAEILPELVRRGVRPDMVTDQTSAHDLVLRLPALGLDGRAMESCAGGSAAARGARVRREAVDRRARECDARVPPHGHPDVRLRQQHPPGRVRRRHRRCVRVPRFRPCVHPAPLLRRQGSVPLGCSFRRPRRHLQDGPQGDRSSFRTTPISGAGSGWRASGSHSRGCRHASAGSDSASAIAPDSRSTKW